MYPSILTHLGNRFDFLNPESSLFGITDIAHALAHLCRFNGHCETFYSVAQHSVLVSHLVPAEDALAGLMHDAHEAFIGDVSAPLKMMLPDYRQLEAQIQSAVLAAFAISDIPSTVKHADLVALATEKRDLMPADATWITEATPSDYRIMTLPPVHAKQQFLARYAELAGYA